MRCAKLLSYLMIEYEVPVIVRHAVRCARLFFFGLVDFHKLVPFRLSSLKITEGEKEDGQKNSDQQVAIRKSEKVGLSSSSPNQFLVELLRKIGQRVAGAQDRPELPEIKEESKQEEEKKAAEEKVAEGSALADEAKDQIVEKEDKEKKESVDTKEQDGAKKEEAAATQAVANAVESQPGARYVVYANINSQSADFTFLITALYHWEKLRPAIAPT